MKKVLTIITKYDIMIIESEVINMNNVVKIGYNEFGTKEILYRITMKTKENKKLYLTEDFWCGKNAEKLICKWTFNRMDALWFETFESVTEFAKDYFKKFKNYEIESFEEIF